MVDYTTLGLSNCNVAAAIIRDEFKAAYLALYIMWQIAILRFLWRQGCAVWFCIERFFQLFARKKLLANETSVTFKASKAKKDFNDDQSSNRNRQNYENNFFHCQTSHVNGRPILHPSRRSSKK